MELLYRVYLHLGYTLPVEVLRKSCTLLILSRSLVRLHQVSQDYPRGYCVEQIRLARVALTESLRTTIIMKTRCFVIHSLLGGLLAVSSLTLPTITSEANALCVAPSEPFAGNWFNTDASTRGIRRVSITFQCNDTVVCPAGDPCPPPPPSGFYIRPFGACSPTDCDWGSQFAEYSSSRRTISARFNPGFAIKTVEASIIRGGRRDGQLRLTHRTHFTDGSGRRDYSMTEYYIRRR